MCVCVCVCMCIYVCVCVCVRIPNFSLLDRPLISSLLVLQGKQRVLVDESTPLLEVSSFQQTIRNFLLSSSFSLGILSSFKSENFLKVLSLLTPVIDSWWGLTLSFQQ